MKRIPARPQRRKPGLGPAAGLAFSLLILLAFAAMAFQPGQLVPSGSSGAGTQSGFAVIFRLALATALVLALAWAFLWLVRRWMVGQKASTPDRWLTVLATSYLAPKKQISLVKVLDRYLVIGVSESGIHHLAELDPGSVSRSLEQVESAKRGDTRFSGLLNTVLTARASRKLR